MRFFQVLLAFGVLGLALWGLSALSSTVSPPKKDFTDLANALTADTAQPAVEDPSASGKAGEEDEPKADYYPTNPFTMPKPEEAHPKAVMAKKTHEFERMALGRKGTHDFILKNEGKVPLKVAKGPTMCKCTLSSVKEQEVAPGEEIKVSVEYEPKSLGLFSQTAIVWTNDPKNPRIEMLITGNMFSEVTMIPQSGWLLGSMPIETEREFYGFVYSSVHPDLEITEQKVTSDQIVVTVEEIPPSEVEVQEPDTTDNILKAFKIKGKVTASEVIGPVRESFTFKTNKPEVPELTLPVQVARTGPMVIISKGWYAEKQMLLLGRIKSAEGKVHKLTLVIDSAGQDLELKNINTGLPFLKLEMEKGTAPSDSSKQRYVLTLTIDKGAPLGEWTGPNANKITFETNHPKIPYFEIHADFEIL